MTDVRNSGLSRIGGLRAVLDGRVILPGDPDYDRSRLIWNGAIDRFPAVVARCGSPADVAAALAYAQREGLEVAVRGGGHGFWGAAVPEDGLMIDLGDLDQVVVDPVARRARCGGGATLAQLDAACQEYGLAVPAGTVSHTGVGGLTLGGGFGWLTSMAGLTIDNLVSAEVVLVDGRIVRASATQYPDLFWALRGGGGNFGVVTEFEFRLHPVGPIVHLGMFFYGLDRAEEAIRLGRDTLAALPRNASGGIAGINAAPAPFVPPELHFTPGVAVLVMGFGSPEEHARTLARIRQAQAPLFELVTPMPYVALQKMLDDGAPWGVHSYTKGLYLDDLTDAAVGVIADALRGKRSPMSQLLLVPLAGAYRDVADQDTAFGGSRAARYVAAVEGIVMDGPQLAGERDWVRSTWDDIRPFAIGSGGYVNLMADVDDARLRATYGTAKYERLAMVKTVYDPDNVLHVNANIKPVWTTSPAERVTSGRA